jgi:hypothetical protein
MLHRMRRFGRWQVSIGETSSVTGKPQAEQQQTGRDNGCEGTTPPSGKDLPSNGR